MGPQASSTSRGRASEARAMMVQPTNPASSTNVVASHSTA